MKHGGDYAKRLRRLFQQLIRKYGRPTTPEPTDPLEQMLVAILAGGVSHYKAMLVFRKLREQMVDLNELRVTPVTELGRLIGPTIPQAEAKAQRIVDVLNDIRRRHDTMDLSFLRQRGRREAREYLESLEGVDRATAASVVLFSLGGHAIPVDETTLQSLRKDGVVDPGADLAEVQSFLERHISANDAQSFAHLLDRHVASRSIRVPRADAEEPAERVSLPVNRPEVDHASKEAAAPTSNSAAPKASGGQDKSASKQSRRVDPKTSSERSSSRSNDQQRKASPRHRATRSGKAAKR